YGYETKNFNRQVKNNIEKFEGEDFMFQLTENEFENLRCKNFTSSWGGSRYLPNAFTEQGIYMLMTVLRGELAIRQSRALIRTFKQMKDFIIENQDFISSKELVQIAVQTNQNTKDIAEIKSQMATKEDLKKVMDNFIDPDTYKHFLLMNGDKIEADVAYTK
ncbi:ORF6N domain-containing protein, partial [Streptococcus agalactiae]|nr:ORF6N domain-containing protein [Streptococcus agalactiae]